MQFADALGRKIVSIASAETVGRVDEFIVDPSTHAVIALAVKKAQTGDILAWPAIASFGEDAVTVADAQDLTEADEHISTLAGKGHRLLGGRVLNTLGDEIGKVHDVEFNPQSGVITALHLDDEQVAGVRLIGIGSYAVVVDATPS